MKISSLKRSLQQKLLLKNEGMTKNTLKKHVQDVNSKLISNTKSRTRATAVKTPDPNNDHVRELPEKHNLAKNIAVIFNFKK